MRVALPIEEIQVSNWPLIESFRLSISRDELTGMWILERIQQDAIHDGKRAVFAPIPRASVRVAMGAKAGDFQEHPNRETQVFDQLFMVYLKSWR